MRRRPLCVGVIFATLMMTSSYGWSCSVTDSSQILCVADFNQGSSHSPTLMMATMATNGTWSMTPPTNGSPLSFQSVGGAMAMEGDRSGKFVINGPVTSMTGSSRWGLYYPISSATWASVNSIASVWTMRFSKNAEVSATGFATAALDASGNMPFIRMGAVCSDGSIRPDAAVVYKEPTSYASAANRMVVALSSLKTGAIYRCDKTKVDNPFVEDKGIKGLFLSFNFASSATLFLDDLMLIPHDVAHLNALAAFDFGGSHTLPPGSTAGTGDFVVVPTPQPFPQVASYNQTGIVFGWKDVSGMTARYNSYLGNLAKTPWIVDPVRSDFIGMASPTGSGATEKVFKMVLSKPGYSFKGKTITVVAVVADTGPIDQLSRYRYMENPALIIPTLNKGLAVSGNFSILPFWPTSQKPNAADPKGWFEQARFSEPELTTSISSFYFGHRFRMIPIEIHVPSTLPLVENGKPDDLEISLTMAPMEALPLAALVVMEGEKDAALVALNHYLSIYQPSVPVISTVDTTRLRPVSSELVVMPIYSGDSIDRYQSPTDKQVTESAAWLSGKKKMETWVVPGDRARIGLNVYAPKELSGLSYHVSSLVSANGKTLTPTIQALRYDIQGLANLDQFQAYMMRPYSLHNPSDPDYAYLGHISAASNRPLWVSADISDQTPAGTYQGTVTIKKEGKDIATVPMALHVLPYAWTKSSFGGGFYLLRPYREVAEVLHGVNKWGCSWFNKPTYSSALCPYTTNTVPTIEGAHNMEATDYRLHHYAQGSIPVTAFSAGKTLPVSDLTETWEYNLWKDANALTDKRVVFDMIDVLTKPAFVQKKINGSGYCGGSAGVILDGSDPATKSPDEGCAWEAANGIEMVGGAMSVTNNTTFVEKIYVPRLKRVVAMVSDITKGTGRIPILDLPGEIDSNLLASQKADKNGLAGIQLGCMAVRAVQRAQKESGTNYPLGIRINGPLSMAVACGYCGANDESDQALPAPVTNPTLSTGKPTYSADEMSAFASQNMKAIADACQATSSAPPVKLVVMNHALLKKVGDYLPIRLLRDNGREAGIYNAGYGRFGHGFYPVGILADESTRHQKPLSIDTIDRFPLYQEGYVVHGGECLNFFDGRNWAISEGCGSGIVETQAWADSADGVADVYYLEAFLALRPKLISKEAALWEAMERDVMDRLADIPLTADVALPSSEIGMLAGWNGTYMESVRHVIQNHTLRGSVVMGLVGAGVVDYDGDGVSTDSDNCPLIANADQIDLDQNMLGDACQYNIGSAPTPPEEPTLPDCGLVPNAQLIDGECVVVDDAGSGEIGGGLGAAVTTEPGSPLEPPISSKLNPFGPSGPSTPPIPSGGASLGGGGGCSLRR